MTGGELLKRYASWVPEIASGLVRVRNARVNEIGDIEVRAGKFPIPLTNQQKALQKAVAALENNR